MEIVKRNLQFIRVKAYQFLMKDVFNMDKEKLSYRIQPDNSLATKKLEDKK
jgi:hypothetical protein